MRPPRAYTRRPLTVPAEPAGNRRTPGHDALTAAYANHLHQPHGPITRADCPTCRAYQASITATTASP